MRRSLAARRNRLLALGAGILVAGSALAAVVMPAQAVTLPVNTVLMTSPGAQATDPIATAVVPVTATETDQTATLTFTVKSVPAGPITIAEPIGPGNATVDLTGTFTAPYSGQVTVTATAAPTAASSGGTVSKTFTWTADNTITVTNPGTQATQVGTPVAGPVISATDNYPAPELTASATGLPPGLAINAATGEISGTPTARGTYPVTVTATDQTGAAKSTTFTWNVTPNLIVVQAKAAVSSWIGVPIKVQARATDSAPGEQGRLTWHAANLPPGLSISRTTGLISGRPTRATALTALVTATDSYGVAGSTTIAFRIATAVIIDNPGPLTTTVGAWLKINPLGTRDFVPGDKPSYSATGLPAGMGFQGSPMLFWGWPAAAGTYSVTVHENGSRGSLDEMTFKLTVKPVLGKSAAGQIRLALDGKCLQDPGGRTANGTPVRIEPCVSGATERWTVDSDGTIRINGRCLDVAGSGGYAGRQLQLDSCGQASPRQLWAAGTRGELIAAGSGLCVTDPGSSRGNGTVPAMGACHVRSYEQWTLPALPILTALGGSCADDHFSAGVNGTVIDMFWCNATMGQNWTLATDGTIRAGLYPGKCLTVQGRKAVIGTCGAGSQWAVVRTAALSSELTQGGVCLAIPSMTYDKGTLLELNGTQLITSACSRTDPRDLWHIG